MTDAQWHRVGSNRGKLKALLDDPVMVEAFSVLRDSEVPYIDTNGKTATDVLMLNGMAHARRAGFFEAIAALKALATDPEPPKAPLTRRTLKQINSLEPEK